MGIRLVGETQSIRLSVAFKRLAAESLGAIPAPPLLILITQVAMAMLLLRNTASQPEALYIFAGKELVRAATGGTPASSNYATYLSGYPYLYPPLTGILDQLGGLETVRLFSTLCMLVVTVCVYFITRRLFTQVSEYVAALLFASLAPTLYLSRIATYDALALMLLAIAAMVALRVSTARGPAGAMVLAPILALAVGAKHAALLFLPLIIGLVAVRTLEERGWRRAILHVCLTLVALAWIVLAVSSLINSDVLAGLGFTTTARTAMVPATTVALLGIIVSLGGVIWALSLLGLVVTPKRVRLTALCLLLTSLAAPAYHLHIGETVSIQKHVGYGPFFAAPLAGYAVVEISSRAIPRIEIRRAAWCLLVLAVFANGVYSAEWWYHNWPDSSQLVTVMRAQLGRTTGKCLCEDLEVLRYYLADTTAGGQFKGLDYFAYTDAQGNRYTGEKAYKAAINAGYFNVVELNFSNTTLAKHLLATLRAQPKYRLIARLPYTDSYTDSYGTSAYMIWVRR